MNRESGSVLILVSGALALMFSIAVIVLLVAGTSLSTAKQGKYEAQVRFSADSAIEVSLGAICKMCRYYNSAGMSIPTATEDLNFDFLDVFLTNEALVNPITHTLINEQRRSIFDLQVKESAMNFMAEAQCHFTDAYTQVRTVEVKTGSLVFPTLQELEEGELVECQGEGTWRLNIFGLGRYLKKVNGIKIPIASAVAMEELVLTYKVAIQQIEEDQPLLAFVYFPSLPELVKREFVPYSEIEDLQWPNVSD